jgi:hypothetical protein
VLHDNACPHTMSDVDVLQQPRFEILQHPPYSADLAVSAYHLFRLLKDALRGHRLASDYELKEVV